MVLPSLLLSLVSSAVAVDAGQTFHGVTNTALKGQISGSKRRLSTAASGYIPAINPTPRYSLHAKQGEIRGACKHHLQIGHETRTSWARELAHGSFFHLASSKLLRAAFEYWVVVSVGEPLTEGSPPSFYPGMSRKAFSRPPD